LHKMHFRRVRQGVEPAVADLAENVPARVGSCDHSIQVKFIQLTTASNGYMQTAAPNGFSFFHGMRVSGEKAASAQIVNSAPRPSARLVGAPPMLWRIRAQRTRLHSLQCPMNARPCTAVSVSQNHDPDQDRRSAAAQVLWSRLLNQFSGPGYVLRLGHPAGIWSMYQ